ncbi:MAG: hypothetical protein R3A48_01815 [Polyangiales bacterium]
MPLTPLAPSLPPLAAAYGLAALLTLTLGLCRVTVLAEHELAARLIGVAQLSLGYGALLVARRTARYTRLLVARAASLSLVATAASLLMNPGLASRLDGALGGATREALHAAALAGVAGYLFVTSPARRRPRSESPTSPA